MLQHNNRTLLTTQEACSMLNHSVESLRQLIWRGRFKKHKIRSRIYLDHDEVCSFYSRKLKLPSFEDLDGDKRSEEFFSLEKVRAMVNYTPSYLRALIKKKELIAYATVDGQILIPKSSLDQFTGVYDEAFDI